MPSGFFAHRDQISKEENNQYGKEQSLKSVDT
jgi:hypothetical protein